MRQLRQRYPKYRYNSYRGRGSGNPVRLIILLLVVLLIACAFWFAQRYVVYSADGSFHFEFPWSQRQSEPESAQPDEQTPAQDLEIIIEEPEEPEPPPVPDLHAYALDASVLQGGSTKALAQLSESDANALVIPVKNSRGQLLYPSQLEEAKKVGAIVGGSISAAAIEELNASDYTTIARIATLHDSLFAYAHMADAAVQQIKYSGYVWYGPNETFYLAPEKELTRRYLSDIAVECAELGFDELLLDEFSYPTVGRLSNINTSGRTMTQAQALALTATEIKAAIKSYDVKLSVVMDAETVLAGENEVSGQSLPDFAQIFDRIYVPTTPEQLPALREALAESPAELIPILSAPIEDGPYLIGS